MKVTLEIKPKFNIGELAYYWDTENNRVAFSKVWAYVVTRYQVLYLLDADDNYWSSSDLYHGPKDVVPVKNPIFRHIIMY